MEKGFIRDSKFQDEVLNNIGLVMANAQEHRSQKECSESFGSACRFAQSIWSRFVNWATLRNAISVLGYGIVLILCLQGVFNGRHTVGEFVMLLAWTVGALGNLDRFSPMHRRIIQHYLSIKKYFDVLAIEPDVKVVPNPVRPEKFNGRIEFKNVTFRYRGRDAQGQIEKDEDENEENEVRMNDLSPALNNISFVIEPGQTVAFVGESGAGKSTLVNALIRAQDPDEGQIIVDGNDLRVLDLKRFRESVGIVNQDVSLFDHTLRYNITYGLNGRAASIGDPELHNIGEMSCVNRFLDRLEKGYDTLIGERGVKLSGGERQRVGIARALIKTPDILIFDEATSNLDSENEAMIQKSIDQASHGHTTIIIAHRFSTIRKADKVIVLEKGQIVGEGTHDELAACCDVYQRLARKQGFIA
jgi:ATP-binding cassette subfamily B protein